MMLNSSVSTSSFFVLEAYVNVGTLRYVYFMVAVLLYVLVLVSNTSLIVLICINRTLHKPMYVFLCSLFVNDQYGSTALFPLLLLQMLSDLHTISVPLCFLQIFCLYTYATVELWNLAVMSYDRYLAICCPLQYHTRMTFKKVISLIAVTWFYSFVKCAITLSLNLRLRLCGNQLDSLYCRNYLIIKLACSDTQVSNVYGLCSVVLSIVAPLVLILFSYVKILQVCVSGSVAKRQKALSTCTPHLVTLINFSFGCCFEVVQTRFDMSSVPTALRLVLSIYFVILQMILNPVMYGMQMSAIRNSCKSLCCLKASAAKIQC